MAFGATTPAKDKSTAGLDTSKIPTNQQGVAMRWFAGVARFAPTWLGPAYNQQTQKPDSGGKGGASAGVHYYGDCAGVFCVGMVDAVVEIWYSQRKIWAGNVQRVVNGVATDFATISTKKGNVTLYWGTETQPVDPILAAQNHPAYLGQCYAVFKRLSFGESADSAPQIEFVLERYPNPANLDQPAYINHDANPVYCQIDLLTHPRYGLGWDMSRLDLVSAAAAAKRVKEDGLGVSPVLDREQDARSVIDGFFDYTDGYIIPDPANAGRLTFGLQRPFTGDPDTLPLLGEYDLTEPPDLQIKGWRDAANEFIVNFTDAANDYQTNGVTFVEGANRRIVGEPLPLTLDRPWITTRSSAKVYAAYAAQRKAIPTTTATGLKVRKESAAGIAPGSFARLTYANWNTTILMRVQRRKVDEDRAQVVEFDLLADGYFADIEVYEADTPPTPDPVLAVPQPPLYQRMLELPQALLPTGANQTTVWLAALVARAGGLDVSFTTYVSEDGTTYDSAAAADAFGVYGTLVADLGVGPTLDGGAAGMLINLPGVDTGSALGTTTERGLRRNKCLVFLQDEIIAYRDVVVTGANQARLVGLHRGCYDTVQALHAAGTAVLIIRRSDLVPFTQDEFEAGDTLYLKVATATKMGVLDLSDAPEQAVPLVARATCPLPPINLQINGNGQNPTYASGSDVVVKWSPAAWQRYGFWQCWEQKFVDDQLGYKIKIHAPAGGVVRSVGLDPGVRTYTYAAADLLADFGGTAPASFKLQVFSRRRGVRSVLSLSLVVTLTS